MARQVGSRTYPLGARRGLIIVLSLIAGMLYIAAPAPVARADGGIRQVPVVWCALKGTDLETASEDARHMALWKLHEVATDHVWQGQAKITFRSAFVKQMAEISKFQVIDDPVPPSAGGPGQLGDIRKPEPNMPATADEMKKAILNCRTAYDQNAEIKAAALNGIVGIYMKRFVDGNGNETSPNPEAFGGSLALSGGAVCGEPPVLNELTNQYVVTEQIIRSFPEATQGALLGHEFGHALTLGHGNGRDDNSNNLVDADCDPAEADPAGRPPMRGDVVCNDPQTVMTPFNCFNNNGTHLEPIQIARANAAALKVPGNADPPPPVPGPVIADSRGDALGDVTQSVVDIARVSVAQDSTDGTTLFAHRLFGTIPGVATATYTTFADLDGDPATGGAPSSLGFDTAFQGAELVTQVGVFLSGEFQVTRTRVWKFVGGSFVDISAEPGVRGLGNTARDPHTGVDLLDVMWVQVPNDLRGPFSVPIRIQALTRGSRGPGFPVEQDRLPEAADGAVNLRVIPPEYPSCSVSPDPVRPGAFATVAVSGLVPNRGAHVVFGAQEVANGMIDGDGNGQIQFRVPNDGRLGSRLVTVGSDGTALTGDCAVTVQGEPVNLPPTLTLPPGDQSVQYSDSLTFGVTASDLDSDPITLAASGLPSALSFTDNGDGTGTVSGTAQVAAGTYPVTFTADDGHNPPVSQSLNIVVTREDAVISPSASNPAAVQVNAPGGTAGPITLTASVTEAADASPGNISNAVPVTYTLVPVGTGTPQSCTATTSGGGVGGTLNTACTFASVPVNVYDVHIAVGGSFYTGSADTVLVVYDPSLGSTTGGGTVTHNGVRADFGFTAKYLKGGQLKGSMLYIEHRSTGDVVLKSNAMSSLVIVKNSQTSYTAFLLGKATLNGVGNYSFRVAAIDNGEPGTNDQFGLQVKDPRNVIVPDLTFNPITLRTGNIVVPHN